MGHHFLFLEKKDEKYIFYCQKCLMIAVQDSLFTAIAENELHCDAELSNYDNRTNL